MIFFLTSIGRYQPSHGGLPQRKYGKWYRIWLRHRQRFSDRFGDAWYCIILIVILPFKTIIIAKKKFQNENNDGEIIVPIEEQEVEVEEPDVEMAFEEVGYIIKILNHFFHFFFFDNFNGIQYFIYFEIEYRWNGRGYRDVRRGVAPLWRWID